MLSKLLHQGCTQQGWKKTLPEYLKLIAPKAFEETGMSVLTLAAHITASGDKIGQVKAELKKLIEPTRAEFGCLQYDLHQDNNNPAHFMFFENWTNYEVWQAHMESTHIKDYMAAVDGIIEDFTVYEMTKLG